MTIHKYITTLILAFALTGVGGWASTQEISFQATVDKKVLSHLDRLTYTLTLMGAVDAEPELPKIEGLEVLWKTELEIQAPNQVRKSWIYTLISEIEEGEVEIPSARLIYKGKTYLTRPIIIKVVKKKAPPVKEAKKTEPAPPPPSPKEKTVTSSPLFIRTEVDKKEAYVNEQITLSFRLFYNKLRLELPPDTLNLPTVGFIKESLGRQKDYQKVEKGLLYNVSEVSVAIFPISSGELMIEPAELKGNVLVPRRRQRRGFFDDLFYDDFFISPFDYERRPFLLRSKPITVKIKPLPQKGRPETFDGAVGSFSLEVAARPPKVKVGDPITLTMKVTGVGNIDSISLPKMLGKEKFKTYAPEVKIKKLVAGDKIAGEKIFKQVIIPLKEGQKEIPSLIFSYFDPDAEEYRTEERAPIPIVVEAAPPRGPVALVEAPAIGESKKVIKILKKDIHSIKDDPGHFFRAGRRYYRDPVYWGAHVIALFLILLVWSWQSRREKLRADLTYARRVRASRAARKRFQEARRWLKEENAEKFYGEVHRAFTRYLGDKLGLPSGAVDPETARNRLGEMGVPSQILEEITGCFETCDRARFARREADWGEMKKFLETLEELVSHLEKLKLK